MTNYTVEKVPKLIILILLGYYVVLCYAAPANQGRVPVCFVLGGNPRETHDLQTSIGININNHTGPHTLACLYMIPEQTVGEFKNEIKTQHLLGNYNSDNSYVLTLWKGGQLKYTYTKDDEPLNAWVTIDKDSIFKLLAPAEVNRVEENYNNKGNCLHAYYMVANVNGRVTGMVNHCGTNMRVRDVTNGIKSIVTGSVDFSKHTLRRINKNLDVIETYFRDSELLDGLSKDDKLAYFSNDILDSHIKFLIEEHERTAEPSKLLKDTDVLFGVELQFETGGGETHKVPEIPIRETTTVAELKADYKGAAAPEDFHLYQLELWDKGERNMKHSYTREDELILSANLDEGDILKFMPRVADDKGKPQGVRKKVQYHVYKIIGIIKKYFRSIFPSHKEKAN
ncbi:hypothetical protein DdX_13356 [Ditylenchus destructor]|uniref:Uncharacterized protein n=1 Tax=Ditylenchus destructor TaxID=166010 RepID=A0AAD4MWY8_9BILA|nr:hypothetical protein DdX_13356 [Ditylenchus destructor]